MGGLSVRDVAVGVAGRTLLADVDLDVAPGELLAVVGPNGCGKSTLLRALAGHAPPLRGTIAVAGRDVRALAPAERARAVTLVGADARALPGTTVAEVVATGRYARGAWWSWAPSDGTAGAVAAALAAVDLADRADRAAETLSSGERRRMWLALALAQDARLVLLDEPTANLDPRHALAARRTMRAMARCATSVVVVSHDLGEAAAIADRIALLGEGGLLALDVPERALDPALLERAYGVAFDRVTVGGRTHVVARALPSAVTGA